MKLSPNQRRLLLMVSKFGDQGMRVHASGPRWLASRRRTMHSLAIRGLVWVNLPNDSHYVVRISGDGRDWIEANHQKGSS